MTKTIEYTDADGNSYSVVCYGDITISGIDPIDEWTLTTVNQSNATEIYPFLGERSTREER